MKNTIKFTPEHEKSICDEYASKINTRLICEKYNFSSPKLYGILKRNGICLHGANRIDEITIISLINLLKAGKTLKESCNSLNISKSCVGKYLKKHNYKVKARGQFIRKYTLNESFLEKIDSASKSQILGILFSDGTASKYNALICLRLQKDDLEYLEKIRKIIQSNKPIYFISGRKFISPSNQKQYMAKDTASLDITSKKFYKDALQCGLIPGKTWLNLGIPEVIPEKYQKDFVLGVFEGDGCLSWNEKHGVASFQFAGSKNMTRDIFSIIKKELNIIGTIRPHSSIFVLDYKRFKDIIIIINWLYNNHAFHMERKYLKCRKFLEYLKKKNYNIN